MGEISGTRKAVRTAWIALGSLAGAGVAVIAPASAQSAVLTYSCATPNGNQTITARWDTTAPATMEVGQQPAGSNLTGTLTIPGSLVNSWWWSSTYRKVTGSFGLTSTTGSTTKTSQASSSQVSFEGLGQAVTLNASGSFGDVAPDADPGTMNITAGNFTATMTFVDLLNRTKTESWNCTLGSGQNAVMDTVAVTSKSTTTLALNPAEVSSSTGARAVATVDTDGGTPAGTVEFSVNGQTITSTVAGGQAVANLPALPAGSYPITAKFLPTDTTLYKGSSASETLTSYDAVSTSTSLTLNPTETTGTSTTATARVTATSGTPAGRVSFLVDGQEAASTALVGGSASANLTGLSLGDHRVEAKFVPNDATRFTASTSLGATVTSRSTSTTTVALSPSSVGAGKRSTATATVSTDRGQAAGTVDFTVDGVTYPAVVAGGKASVELPGLEPGSYEVTAAFKPTETQKYVGSSGTGQLEVFAAQRTTTSLGLSASSTTGDPVTASAHVAADAGTPQGSVRFTAGDQTVSVPVDAQGNASAKLHSLPLGTHDVVATYLPDDSGRYAGSASEARTLRVRATSATTLVLSREQAETTDEVTAAVAVTTSQGTPAGTVTLNVGGIERTATVQGGEAELTLPSLAPGSYKVHAEFAPSDAATYAGSSATARSLEITRSEISVEPQQSNMSIQLAKPVTVPGEANAVTATVASKSPGTVVFNMLGRSTTVRVASGKAVTSLPLQTVGRYPIQAQFTPDDPQAATSATASTALVVTRAKTTTRATATYARAARTATVAATVRPPYRRPLNGTVTYTLKRGTTVVARRTVGIRPAGTSNATFTKVKRRGLYTVQVRYSGGTEHLGSSATTQFRVR